jgi:diguanylate cyclase (GGDEF)-like protein
VGQKPSQAVNGRTARTTAPPHRPRARPKPEKDAETVKPAKAPGLATATRLAAEVDRLTAELAASQALISELETRVDVDPLTEILNRRGFERALARSLAYVKRYRASAALVYLDLDDFKPVNDRHGHAAGDAVLKAVAAALQAEVRSSDIVARIGGDEFAALLWNVSQADAAAKAAALEGAVYATPVRWHTSTMGVGASAGLAWLGPLDAPADVLARADAAMYARKMEKQTLQGANGTGSRHRPVSVRR